jgi:hypothetical protein
VFSNVGFAKMTLIQTESINEYLISTICIDTHKFVFTTLRKGGTESINVSVVQFMKMDRNYGVTIVGRCKN